MFPLILLTSSFFFSYYLINFVYCISLLTNYCGRTNIFVDAFRLDASHKTGIEIVIVLSQIYDSSFKLSTVVHVFDRQYWYAVCIGCLRKYLVKNCVITIHLVRWHSYEKYSCIWIIHIFLVQSKRKIIIGN